MDLSSDTTERNSLRRQQQRHLTHGQYLTVRFQRIHSFCSCSIDLISSIIIEGSVSIPSEGLVSSDIPVKSIEFETIDPTTIGDRAFKGNFHWQT